MISPKTLTNPGSDSGNNSLPAKLLTWLSYALLPGHCLLCKSDTKRRFDLCAVCEQDLPCIGTRCDICSVPVHSAILIDSNSEPDPLQQRKPKLVTCGNCQHHPPPFSATIIPYLYQAPVDQLIWRFKYKGNLVAGRVLAQLLAKNIRALHKTEGAIKPDFIIPVPLHWRRRFSRGFNQACELAVVVGRQLEIPVTKRLIKRVIHTPAQQSVNRKQRQSNTPHSFVVRATKPECEIKGRSFAIIDDVMTTGSTVNAIARLLVKNGAAQVVVWAIARTPLEN